MAVTVRAVVSSSEIAEFAALAAEYGRSLEYTCECASLEHQGFDDELAHLPGRYAAASRGSMLVAYLDEQPAGCVALRDLGDNICEMKRMYVRPVFQRRGIGRSLGEAVLTEARRLGYARMRLDTGASMHAATALYQSLGFSDIPAYNRDPVPGTRWMELELDLA